MARPTTIFNYIQHDPMLEWLVEVDPESGQYMPWLAESWQVAPDGRSWTMKLQKTVQYHPTVQCVYRGHRRSQDRRRLAIPGWDGGDVGHTWLIRHASKRHPVGSHGPMAIAPG